MHEEEILTENFLWEENVNWSIEAIQEKTGYHLAKLFEYFWEEEQKNIL